MPASDSLRLIGTTVGQKYLVDQVVGDGGFAIVYQATHVLWNRKVALKVFRVPGDLAPEHREKLVKDFLQEGTLLADLSERCAGICQARDVGTLTTTEGERLPYIVLEWLEGRTLAEVLEGERGRRMPPRTLAEAVRLLEPAARALGVAHERGIAHRDVKPANLFVLGDPRGPSATLKVLDFGIAKVVEEAQNAGSFQRTGGWVTSFTPAYGAPEQFSRSVGATGPWTDVYALALVLIELFTNIEVLRGDDLARLFEISCDPARRPTPRTLGVEVDDAVEAVFARAVALAPSARFADADALLDALLGALGLEPQSMSRIPTSSKAFATATPIDSTLTLLEPPPVAELPVQPAPLRAPEGRHALGKGTVVAVVAVGALLALAGTSLAVRPLFARPARPASVADPARSAPAPMPIAAPSPPRPACPAGMVKIDGGRFYMGSDDGLPNERPAHKVSLAPYCIDVFEVTTEAYKACSDEGECKRAGIVNAWEGITKSERTSFDPLCNANDPASRGRHPVNCVDWEMARVYCSVRADRLPSEAEWEFAARGPDGRKYPWGDDPPSPKLLNACGPECVAWGKKNNVELTGMYSGDDGWATTAPVGSFPAGKSRYGLEDVVGNVWEWVADRYKPYQADDPAQPTAPSTGTAQPAGTPEETMRVIRGGAWNGGYEAWVRPTFRYRDVPEKRSYGIGFRCAANLR